MKRVLFLYNRRGRDSITGGQKYEAFLYECLSSMTQLSVEKYSIYRNLSRMKKIIAPIKNLKELYRIRNYDIVFFNSSECCYLLLLCLISHVFFKKKILIIHHHYIYFEFVGVKRIFYKFFECSFLQCADTIVIPSPYIKELCKKGFPKKRIFFWEIPFEPLRLESPLRPNKGQLLFMGTIEPRKGIIYLLEALNLLYKDGYLYHLTIIGKVVDDIYFQLLRQKIIDYNLNVEFTGYVTTEQKKNTMLESDIFVFPSLLEGYGMVICEAMQYGLPVVGFDNSAMPYSIKDHLNGVIVRSRDIDALANAIKEVVENRKMRELLSIGAIDYVATLPTNEDFKKRVIADVVSLWENTR